MELYPSDFLFIFQVQLGENVRFVIEKEWKIATFSVVAFIFCRKK